MALATVIAGPYTGTYNAVNVGMTEDGFRLAWTVDKELVTGDAYGGSVIDAVYRGGNMFLSFMGIEYDNFIKTAAIGPSWPYGNFGRMGVVGRTDDGSGLALATVLTAVAGTPAATKPASLTATHSILDESARVEMNMNARARKAMVPLRLYPYDLGAGVIGWFSLT